MPTILLAIYIILIFIRPMDWWEPLIGLELVTAAAAITFTVGLPKILAWAPQAWRTIPQMRWGLALLASAVLSWLPTFWFGGMQNAFEQFGRLIFFFSLILILVNTKQDYKILIWTFLGCAIWMAVHAILQQRRGFGFGGQTPLWRLRNVETGEFVWQSKAFGTFEDPNDLCAILVIAIPMLYALYKASRHPVSKVISLAGVPICGYGAWCTNSRGGIVAIFGMLATYAIARTKGIRRYLMASASILLVTTVAPSRFGKGMVVRDRAVLWGDGISMFKDNPFFGVAYMEYPTHQGESMMAHNTYVQILAELGLIGYLPFFLIIYLTIVQLRRAIALKAHFPSADQFIMAGIFSSLAGYLTAMYFISRQYHHVLYVVLALSITFLQSSSRSAGVLDQVIGNTRKDLKHGLYWGLGSIVVMWVTVRIANALG